MDIYAKYSACQKANKIIRQSSPRRFIDFTKEEQRIVWACISLKNDFKEQKRIIWYGMPRGKEIQIDYKTNFLLSNVYFSKLFGTTFKDSSFHIKHGTALLSKDFNTVEIFNDIKFMIKKSGWIDKINHKITTVSTINTQENCSEHLFRIKFYDDVLESFQNSENENEPEYEDV